MRRARVGEDHPCLCVSGLKGVQQVVAVRVLHERKRRERDTGESEGHRGDGRLPFSFAPGADDAVPGTAYEVLGAGRLADASEYVLVVMGELRVHEHDREVRITDAESFTDRVSRLLPGCAALQRCTCAGAGRRCSLRERTRT